jgi:hypothetical protein
MRHVAPKLVTRLMVMSVSPVAATSNESRSVCGELPVGQLMREGSKVADPTVTRHTGGGVGVGVGVG